MQKKNIIFLLLLVFYIYFYISGTYGAEWTTKNIFPPNLKLVKKTNIWPAETESCEKVICQPILRRLQILSSNEGFTDKPLKKLLF